AVWLAGADAGGVSDEPATGNAGAWLVVADEAAAVATTAFVSAAVVEAAIVPAPGLDVAGGVDASGADAGGSDAPAGPTPPVVGVGLAGAVATAGDAVFADGLAAGEPATWAGTATTVTLPPPRVLVAAR